jgi:hypothetical protein
VIKGKLIELIRGRILGGSASVDRLHEVDQRRIELAISAVLNTIFYTAFRVHSSNLDTYSKTYKNVAISQDPDTNIYFSILPAKVVQFPRVSDGIMNINEMKNEMKGKDVMFVPMKSDDNEMMFGIESDLIDDVVKYIRKGGIVEYYNLDPTITKVRMDLVVDFTEWGMTEDFPVPSGQDNDLVNMVTQYLKSDIRPTDLLNNENEIA